MIPGSGKFLEKEMATHSSILAWEIPGQRSLVGYSLWGRKELDMTERLTLSHTLSIGRVMEKRLSHILLLEHRTAFLGCNLPDF